jgi:hypothetical protein
VNYRVLIFFLLLSSGVKGQVDSTARQDTSLIIAVDTLVFNPADTFRIPDLVVVPMKFDSLYRESHPVYRFTEPIRTRESARIPPDGKEDLFYSVLGLLLFFALIRNSFRRYFQDLFRLLFRTRLQQKQAREQLMQTPLASLLLNILFILSASLFINLLLRHYHLGLNYPFWVLFFYCAVGLIAIYLVKFFTLKVFGWIFRVSEATDVYTLIVFTINKVVGILLLPIIIFTAFTTGQFSQFLFSVGLILIACLFAYRYYISYGAVHRQIRVNFFHFLLYLFAVEIVPLLLINKLLFGFLS